MGDIATTPAGHHDPDDLSLLDPADVPPFGPYARWSRRVVAAILDGALLTGVTFLAVGPIAPPPVLPFFTPIGDIPVASVDGTTWQDSAWIIGTVVALILLQAYTGATPGKRTVGISVVHRETGRPVGIVTTVLRWLAHFLDAILCIGYLRPLWDKERRTFADGLLSTFVVRSARPLPWTLRTSAPWTRQTMDPSGAPEAPSAPGTPPTVAWWDRSPGRARAITATATVLCLGGVGLSFSNSFQVLPLTGSSACAVTRVAPSSEGLTGFGATMNVWGQGRDTRLGITRAAAPDPGSSSIAVDLAGATDGYVSIEAIVVRADGTRAWSTTEDFGALTMVDPLPSQAAWLHPSDGLPAGLDAGWTWEVRLIVDDVIVETCTGEAPVLS
jgi:Mce-associated membrane protein